MNHRYVVFSFHPDATADLASAERMVDHYETTSAHIATADLVSAERITRREAFRAANRLSTGTRPVEQCEVPSLGCCCRKSPAALIETPRSTNVPCKRLSTRGRSHHIRTRTAEQVSSGTRAVREQVIQSWFGLGAA